MNLFLIDENLSPKISYYLREKGYKAYAVREISLRGKKDKDIISWAIEKNAIIITCDKDFANFYFLKLQNKIGIIILEFKKQSLKYQIK